MHVATQAFSITRFLGTESDSKIFKLKEHVGSSLDINTSAFPVPLGYMELPSNYALLGYVPHHAPGWQTTAYRFPRQASAKIVNGHGSKFDLKVISVLKKWIQSSLNQEHAENVSAVYKFIPLKVIPKARRSPLTSSSPLLSLISRNDKVLIYCNRAETRT